MLFLFVKSFFEDPSLLLAHENIFLLFCNRKKGGEIISGIRRKTVPESGHGIKKSVFIRHFPILALRQAQC